MCYDEDSYDNYRIADIVYNEGLGYAVDNYIAAEEISDPELAKLWQVAIDALKAVEVFLADYR